MNVLQGPELLPDHPEARGPVGDPQEAGQGQRAALLLRGPVPPGRPAHAEELRHLQLRESTTVPLEPSSDLPVLLSAVQPDSEVAQAGRSLEVFFLARLREVFPGRRFPAATQETMDRARLRWLRKKKEGSRRKKHS